MQITIRPKLEFDIAPHKSWHIKRSKSVLTDGGVRQESRLVPSTDCYAARLFSGFVFARLAYAKARPGTLKLDCAGGRRLIAIEVTYDKPVCIDVGSVVAMSSTVRFRSCVSFSLAAASANRVFVKQAVCPRPGTRGTVVLETAGEPTLAAGNNPTFEVSRMIAWDPAVKFRATPLESIPGMLINHVLVSASLNEEDDSVLLDADHAGSAFSLWRVIRPVLSLVIPGL